MPLSAFALNVSKPKVEALAKAADDCWAAIMRRDLQSFAAAYRASFDAQVAMFPGMVDPYEPQPAGDNDGFLPTVRAYIEKYSAMPGVLAWKMPGAGGGGYLALVIDDKKHLPDGAIELHIRRGGM